MSVPEATDPVRIFRHVENGNPKLVNRNAELPQVRGIFLYDEARNPDDNAEKERVGIFETPYDPIVGSRGDIVLRTIPHGDVTVGDLLEHVKRPDRLKSWGWNAQAGNTNGVGVVAPTIAGNSTADNDDTTTWTKYTSDGISAPAGPISTFNVVRRAHNPLLIAMVKTPTDLSDVTFWVGIGSAAPTDDTGPLHHAAFRFSTTAGDAGWVLSTRGGGAQTITNLPIIGPPGIVGRARTMVANTSYKMLIQINNDTGQVVAQIDGGVEEWDNALALWVHKPRKKLTVTTSLPLTSQDMGVFVRAISTDPLFNAKSISMSRLYVQHK